MAKEHHHSKVHLIDYPSGMSIDSLMAFAQENDPDFFQRSQNAIQKFISQMNQMQ